MKKHKLLLLFSSLTLLSTAFSQVNSYSWFGELGEKQIFVNDISTDGKYYYVVGNFASNSFLGGPENNDSSSFPLTSQNTSVLKLDLDGRVLSLKKYVGSGGVSLPFYPMVAEPVKINYDTFLYFIHGIKASGSSPYYGTLNDLMITKAGKNHNGSGTLLGDNIWTKNYQYKCGDNASKLTLGHYFDKFVSPGIVTLQYSKSFSFSDNCNTLIKSGAFIKLAKVDYDGNPIYTNYIETDVDFERGKIIQTIDSNYLFVGDGQDSCIIIKIKHNTGSVIWTKSIGAKNRGKANELVDVIENSDTSLYIYFNNSYNSQYGFSVLHANSDLSNVISNSKYTHNSINQKVDLEQIIRINDSLHIFTSKDPFGLGQPFSIGSVNNVSQNAIFVDYDLVNTTNNLSYAIHPHDILLNASNGITALIDREDNSISSKNKFQGMFQLDQNLKLHDCDYSTSTVTHSNLTHNVKAEVLHNYFALDTFYDQTYYLSDINYEDSIICFSCLHDTSTFDSSALCKGDTLFINKIKKQYKYAWVDWYRADTFLVSTKESYLRILDEGDYTAIGFHSPLCYDTIVGRKIVNNWPRASFHLDNMCGVDSVKLVNTSTGSLDLYDWHNFGYGLNSSVIDFTYFNDSCYTDSTRLIITDSFGCQDTTGLTYKLIDNYNVEISMFGSNFSDSLFCAYTGGNFYAGFQSCHFGNRRYQWTWDDTIISENYSVLRSFYNTTTRHLDTFRHVIRLELFDSNSNCLFTSEKVVIPYAVNTYFTYDKTCSSADSITFYNRSWSKVGGYSVSQATWRFERSNSLPFTRISSNPLDSVKYKFNSIPYWVSLTHDDSLYCTAFYEDTVLFYGAPIAGFNFSYSCAQDTAYFTNTSVDGHSYNWDFGDGSQSSNQHPKHIYSNAGTYTVTLITFTINGCADTIQQIITVNAALSKPIISQSPIGSFHCFGEDINFTASNLTNHSSSNWNVKFRQYSGFNKYNTSLMSYIVSLMNTGQYKIFFNYTDSSGCNAYSDTIIINSLKADTILYSNKPSPICSGDSILLSGIKNTSYQSYVWQHSIDSGITWQNVGANNKTYSAKNQGLYRYISTTFSGGCSDTTSPFALSIMGGHGIAASPSALMEAGTPLNLNIPGTSISGVEWFRSGIPINLTSSNIIITKPGTYFAIVTDPCGRERTEEIEILYDGSLPNWDQTYVNGNTFSAGTYLLSLPSGLGYTIEQDLILQSGADVTITCPIVFSNCSQIKVENGATLRLSGGAILSGNPQWTGIGLVGDNSTLIMNGGEIWNANTAIVGQQGANITIENASFGDNVRHSYLNQTNPLDVTVFHNNVFGHCKREDTLLYCGYPLQNYANINLTQGIWNQSLGSAQTTFSTNRFYLIKNMPYAQTAVKHSGNGQLKYMMNQDTGYFDTTLNLESGALHEIVNNIIHRPSSFQYLTSHAWPYGTAFQFKQIEVSDISGNNIFGCDYGIQYYRYPAPNETPSIIEDNEIYNSTFGLLASYHNNPYNSLSPFLNRNVSIKRPIPLTVQCNRFENNTYHIVGLGDWIDQGTSALAASNKFLGSTVDALNWEYLVNSSNYYFQNFLPENEPKYYILPASISLDGQTLISNIVDIGGAQVKPCFSSLQPPPEDVLNEVLVSNIYPNPGYAEFYIEKSQDATKFIVFDLVGRVIIENKLINQVTRIETSNFSSGTYLVAIYNRRGLREQTFKWIKVNN
jgi:PKD repeat protein